MQHPPRQRLSSNGVLGKFETFAGSSPATLPKIRISGAKGNPLLSIFFQTHLLPTINTPKFYRPNFGWPRLSAKQTKFVAKIIVEIESVANNVGLMNR